MKTLIYTGLLGPATVSFGDAGQFVKGEPRQIDDDALADSLLAKGCFEEQLPAVLPEPAARKAKTTSTVEEV